MHQFSDGRGQEVDRRATLWLRRGVHLATERVDERSRLLLLLLSLLPWALRRGIVVM